MISKSAKVFVSSFHRPNLRLSAAPKIGETAQLLEFLQRHKELLLASGGLHRDAGDFRCDGSVRSGTGAGTCTYAPNAEFVAGDARSA